MATTNLELPLTKETTQIGPYTSEYDEIATITFPLNRLRPEAQSLADFPSPGSNPLTDETVAYRSFLEAFLQVTVLASRTGKFEFLQELVLDSEEKDVIAIRLWTLFSPPVDHNAIVDAPVDDSGDEMPEGSAGWADIEAVEELPEDSADLEKPTLNNFVRQTVQYWSDTARKITTGKNASARVAARVEFNRLKGRGLQYESWKTIESTDEWAAICSTCLGLQIHDLDDAPVFRATESVFSTPMSLATPMGREVLPCQSIESMGDASTSYLMRRGNAWQVRWPRPDLVYRYPPSIPMAGVQSVMQRLLPHVQARRRKTDNHLSILLPALVKPDKEDVVMAPPDPVVLSEMLSSCGLPAVKLAPLENRMASARRLSSKRRVFSDAFADGGAAQMAEQKRFATAYHAIHHATDSCKQMITELVTPKYGTMASRKAQLLIENAALDSYLALGPSAPRMSPHMKILLEESARLNLLTATPELRDFFRRPKKADNLSPLGNDMRKFLMNMEVAFKVNHLHDGCRLVELCSLDAYRCEDGLRLNFLALSENGGTGKSNMWEILEQLRVDGTLVNVTYTTAAGFTGTSDPDNPNMSDKGMIYDEMPPALFGFGDKGIGPEDSRFRTMLSTGQLQVDGLALDDSGKRRAVSSRVEIKTVVFGSSNIPLDKIIHATLTRFVLYRVPEEPVGRNLGDTINLAQLDPVQMKTVAAVFRRVYWVKQTMFAHFFKLQWAGVLPKVSTDLCGLITTRLMQHLRQTGTFVEPNSRLFSRVKLLAQLHTVWRAMMFGMLTPNDNPDTNMKRALPHSDDLGPSVMAKQLPLRLFASVEDVCQALLLMSGEIVNPLEHAVRLVIAQLFKERQAEDVKGFEDMFRRVTKTRINSQVQGGKDEYFERDYNYVVFRMADLLPLLDVRIPDVMNGEKTNTNSIMQILGALTHRQITSRPYVGSMNMNGHMTIRPDTTKLPRKFPMARLDKRRTVLELHTEFVNAAVESAKRGNTSTDARGILVDALIEILGAKNQLPRKIAAGADAKQPKKPVLFETKEKHSEFFTVHRAMVIETEDFDVMPELCLIPDARARFENQRTIVIKEDLDVYAMKQHYERLFVSEKKVDPGFLKVLHEDDAEGETASQWFGREPLKVLIEDKYAEWARRRRDHVVREMQREVDEDDIEFDAREFAVETPSGDLVYLKDALPNYFSSPLSFGADSWDKISFKMIAHHPLVEQAYLDMLGV